MDSLEVPRPGALPAPGDPAPRRSSKRKRDKPSAPPPAPPGDPKPEEPESPGTLDLLT